MKKVKRKAKSKLKRVNDGKLLVRVVVVKITKGKKVRRVRTVAAFQKARNARALAQSLVDVGRCFKHHDG
jgi:hypothetical protein